jgi:hypothetical protein
MSAEAAQPVTLEEAQSLVRLDAELAAALRRVEAIDFTWLKAKLVLDGELTAELCDEAEGLYRRFLALNMRYPDLVLCPTGPIDRFWHAHILDTLAYERDCAQLFGRTLRHFPYFGMRGPEDRAELERAFERSIDLFIRHFGIDPTAGDTTARSCRPQNCP